MDFNEALDTLERLLIYKTLLHFGFGEKFRQMVQTLYKDISSSVSLINGTSLRFDVKRGIRQGCPISPLLFLVAELINFYTAHCTDIEGIKIGEK